MNTLSDIAARARTRLGGRVLVFVGLMGAGKSAIGRLTAAQLGLAFADSDHEIEAAARMPINDLFATYGEDEFRLLEERIIRRLLGSGPKVLSTGGGAFVRPAVRRDIARHGLSLWLKADLDLLWQRVRRKSHRPLLHTKNPKERLFELMQARYPLYALADLTVQSRDVEKQVIVEKVMRAIATGSSD